MVPDKKQYPLRINPAVFKALEAWASDEFRSINGQIEFILRQALRNAGRLPTSSESLARIKEVEE